VVTPATVAQFTRIVPQRGEEDLEHRIEQLEKLALGQLIAQLPETEGQQSNVADSDRDGIGLLHAGD